MTEQITILQVGTVRKVKVNGTTSAADADGVVDLGDIAGGASSVEDLTDSTATGVALVTAADAAAARAAIGAGTSSVVVGSAAGQAADAAATAAAIAAKYTKPGTGVPASDLASAVQTSLGKADTALQSAPVASVAGKTGAVTLTAADVSAVPTTRTVAGKALSADVTLAASDVGAVPTARTVAGLDLSADRTAAALKTALALVKTDVGLGSVDNTADSAKPVSTAQAAAIAANSPTSYGNWPRVFYTGSAWPSRSSSIPSGYSGHVYFDSVGYSAAVTPSDMTTGDRWERSSS